MDSAGTTETDRGACPAAEEATGRGKTALPAPTESLLQSLGVASGGARLFRRKGTPLLLLPDGDRGLAGRAIGLYEPQTVPAKAAALALRALCAAGLLRFLPKCGSAGEGEPAGVLFCNHCHGTRLVAVRRASGGRFEIVKAALDADAGPLRRERARLAALGGRPGVPEAGPLETRGGATFFTLPFFAKARRAEPFYGLLAAWVAQGREPAEENGLVRDAWPFLDSGARREIAGRPVRKAFVHGDFAPWNWRVDDAGRPVCIDWEFSRDDGFSGFDLVYCIVQRLLLVDKASREDLLPAARARFARLPRETRLLVGESGLSFDAAVAVALAYRRFRGMD